MLKASINYSKSNSSCFSFLTRWWAKTDEKAMLWQNIKSNIAQFNSSLSAAFEKIKATHNQFKKNYPEIFKSDYDQDLEALTLYYQGKKKYCDQMLDGLQTLDSSNKAINQYKLGLNNTRIELSQALNDFQTEKETKKQYKSDIRQLVNGLDNLTSEQFKQQYQALMDTYNRDDFMPFSKLHINFNLNFEQDKTELKAVLDIKVKEYAYTKDYTALVENAEKTCKDYQAELDLTNAYKDKMIQELPQLKAYADNPEKGLSYHRELHEKIGDFFHELDDWDESRAVTKAESNQLERLYHNSRNKTDFIDKLRAFAPEESELYELVSQSIQSMDSSTASIR